MPKISVILPIYNSQDFLLESIESILKQTFKDFTIFAINDGSKDNSLGILDKISDKRLKIVCNDGNQGLIYTLNKGIDLSKDFEYVARMDSDDISFPNRFQREIECLESNKNVGVVGTSIKYFGDGIKSKEVILPEKNDKILPAFLCRNPVVHPSVMIRNSLFQNHDFRFDKEFVKYEDYKLWLDLFNVCEFYNIQEVLLSYRRHLSNVSNEENYDLETDMSIIKRIIFAYLEKLEIELSEMEVYVTSIITSTYRWKVDRTISVGILFDSISSVIDKHPSSRVNKYYLKHLLWERGLIYLLKSRRKKDFVWLVSKLNIKINYNRIFSIHTNWF